MREFLTELAVAEISGKIIDLMESQGRSLETVVESVGLEPEDFQVPVDPSTLTIAELVAILEHLGYKMLFSYRPLNSGDAAQAASWERS